MSAYADVEDLKARAGRIRGAWDDTTEPNDGDLERFIRDASAAVDIALATHGFAVPATDVNVVGSLLPVVADIALLMALAATYPGGSGPQSVTALYEDVRVRVEGKDGKGGYLKGLADGTLPALQTLTNQDPGTNAGAADFWTQEQGYSSWLDDYQSGAFHLTADGRHWFQSPMGPGVHRDTKF